MTLKSQLRKLAPRTIRAHRILGGPLRGRMIVTSLHDYPGAILGRTEKPLLAWFRQNVKPGQTWLDVGAHYGYTAIALAELVGSQGYVYAFEPSLTTAGHLSRTCTLNRLHQVKVVPIGLGDPGGLRMLSVPVDRGMANHLVGNSPSQDIYIIGFDQFWEPLGEGSLVHGVKIDVQGMELSVLAGMSHLLAHQQPRLVLEFHPGVDRRPILELVSRAHYRLPGTPIEPLADETKAAYHDDRSYYFGPQ